MPGNTLSYSPDPIETLVYILDHLRVYVPTLPSTIIHNYLARTLVN